MWQIYHCGKYGHLSNLNLDWNNVPGFLIRIMEGTWSRVEQLNLCKITSSHLKCAIYLFTCACPGRVWTPNFSSPICRSSTQIRPSLFTSNCRNSSLYLAFSSGVRLCLSDTNPKSVSVVFEDMTEIVFYTFSNQKEHIHAIFFRSDFRNHTPLRRCQHASMRMRNELLNIYYVKG